MTISRRQFLATSAALASAAPFGAWSQSGSKFTMQAAWVNDAEFMGYFVAMDKGYYTSEGMELTYLSGGPDVIPEASLLSNKADVCLSTVETTIRIIVIGRFYRTKSSLHRTQPLFNCIKTIIMRTNSGLQCFCDRNNLADLSLGLQASAL